MASDKSYTLEEMIADYEHGAKQIGRILLVEKLLAERSALAGIAEKAKAWASLRYSSDSKALRAGDELFAALAALSPAEAKEEKP